MRDYLPEVTALLIVAVLVSMLIVSQAQAQTAQNWAGDLFWDPVTTDIDGNPVTILGYNLFKGPRNGPYTKVNSSIILSPTFNDPNGAVRDCYVATAVAQGGLESNFSVVLCVTPPASPVLRFFLIIVNFLKNLWSWV